jgi:riboflavin synthase
MFTGIIEGTGRILEIIPQTGSKRVRIGYLESNDLKTGESVNVNGACQTVIKPSGDSFWVEAMQETLKRTNFGSLKIGDDVNLERSLQLSGRISGHLVTGHIDVTGSVLDIQPLPDSWIFKIEIPEEYSRYVAPKGSIAVNGISLTIIEAGAVHFTVGIIPFTWGKTNLKDQRIGESLNLEFDLIAKYLERLINIPQKQEKITAEFLKDAGW